MKKDFIFAPILLVIAVALFLLKVTGIGAHIAVSVAGIAVLVAYSVLTKKEWKLPALEIVMRAFYGIALITGALLMKLHNVTALPIVHKASAALFVVLLLVLFVHKLVTAKKN